MKSKGLVSPSFPMSSGEMPVLDSERAEIVAQRHQQLVESLRSEQLDGVLINEPENFSWFTCGGDSTQRGNQRRRLPSILVTAEARVILCNNVDSGQLFDRELMGLGFQVKERPWTEDPAVLRWDICRGRKIATDRPWQHKDNAVVDLTSFRTKLAERELNDLRNLGRDLAHAVEATARNFDAGASEAEIAGHLTHRMIKRQIEPVAVKVMADVQGWRYRQWAYVGEAVKNSCVLSATGRRHGLHVSVARTCSQGPPSEELLQSHFRASTIQAAALMSTHAGRSIADIWAKVAETYEACEAPDEWRSAEQGDVIGYSPSELTVRPDSLQRLGAGMAVHWYPSVHSSLVGDTMIINESRGELVTVHQSWPAITVVVDGVSFLRPGIYQRG